MAGPAGVGAALCSERFGSQAARGCSAAADGSLRWETWGRRWWGGAGAAPGPAAPPLPRLLTVFLPQGFPDSVSPDYLPYQLWDSVQVSVAGREAARRLSLPFAGWRQAPRSWDESQVALPGELPDLPAPEPTPPPFPLFPRPLLPASRAPWRPTQSCWA